MKRRTITGLVLAFILIPAILFPQLARFTQILCILVVIGAALELLNMYDKEKKLPVWLKAVTVILTLFFYFSILVSYQENLDHLYEIGSVHEAKDRATLVYLAFDYLKIAEVIDPEIIISISFIILMSCMVFVHKLTVPDIGKLFVSIIYVGVCAGAFTILWFVGVRFVVYLLLITCGTDIFALIFGMLFGKHKMAPYISPKKTWEGAIGGTITAVVIGFIFLFCYQYLAPLFGQQSYENFFEGFFPYHKFSTIGKIFFTVVLTASVSICSQIGDLLASKLKRNYGIKDYSQIFPGHGGILDRFDSIFFASAIFLVFLILEECMFGLF